MRTSKTHIVERAINKRTVQNGFSLIELLVVIVILGLIASVVGPNVMSKIGGAKQKTARVQIEDLSAALDLFLLDVGRYPTSSEGLSSLVEASSNIDNWQGPYLRKSKIPNDPWGRQYHYKSPGDHGEFDIWSLGGDNASGGEGKAADILSWE